MKSKDAHPYVVTPGKPAKLSKRDPSDSSLFKGDKDQAQEELEKILRKVEELQDLLYAAHGPKLLIILQGLDACGKDGTIRNVFDGMDPLGIRVATFKAPTAEELDHDFLWRVHRQVPGKGEVAIFNRSHYEDVLVVRVKKLVPAGVWRARYQQINDFERVLSETGTTILKFHLQIDRDEQRKRLQQRIEDPTKRWKFRSGDLDDRKLWDDYMEAYEEAITRTSTPEAPWYVIPSNRKWYRNLVISHVIRATLQSLKLKYPAGEKGIEGTVVK